MANKQISDLTTATLPLDGTEQAHFKQGANSREINLSEIRDFIGKGPLAQGLGHAKFTQPGNVFTAYNSGTPVSNAFDAATGHWLIEHLPDDEMSAALATVAAGDFDKVFAVSAKTFQDDTASAKNTIGVMVSDGVDSITWELTDVIAPTWEENYRGTDRFTFGSNNANVTMDGSGPLPFDTLIWFRVTRVTSAITFYVSHNGFDWDTIFTSTDTANSMSSVLEVGVFMNTDNGTDTNPQFLRVVGYDDGPQAEAKTGGGALPVAFKGVRAGLTGNVVSGSGVSNSILTFNDVSSFNAFDPDSVINGSGQIVVPSSWDGKYAVFDLQLAFSGTVEDGKAMIAVDGSLAAETWYDDSFTWHCTTGPILLTAGMVIRAQYDCTTAHTLQDSRITWFSGYVIETSEDAFDYVEDTGTSRTLTGADFKGNRTVELNNASAITVTLNTGLDAPGPLTIIQGGAGVITISGTATIESNGSLVSSGGQNTAMTLIPSNTTDTYKLIGTLA